MPAARDPGYSGAMAEPSTESSIAYRTVGVLGGMGALATVDFLHKLVLATPASTDQQQVPLLVRFCPEVPDRVDALFGRGPSPEQALVAAAQALERGGAECLAIPCNTAHAWHDAIAAGVSIPVLHIADSALAAASQLGIAGAVGLLGTTGTLHSGIYPARGPGIEWVLSTEREQAEWVAPGIRAVKTLRAEQGGELLRQAAQALVQRGATIVIMACTEIPIALAQQDIGVPLVDPTLTLARACVAWAGTAD